MKWLVGAAITIALVVGVLAPLVSVLNQAVNDGVAAATADVARARAAAAWADASAAQARAAAESQASAAWAAEQATRERTLTGLVIAAGLAVGAALMAASAAWARWSWQRSGLVVLRPVEAAGKAFPALVQGGVVSVLPAPQRSRATGELAAPGATALVEAAAGQEIVLPTAPAWAEVLAGGFMPTRERVLLGYAASGPVYGPLTHLLSVGIVGRPGQGKSTLLRLIAHQVMLARGVVIVWDLHGSVIGDVPGAQACGDVVSIEASAAQVIEELERRRRLGRPGLPPVLVLIDEWNVLAAASAKAVTAAGHLVLEGRKFQMFTLISGQGLPASQFGGALVRDALSSRYVFRTTPEEARRCKLDRESAQMVKLLRPGVAILEGPIDPTIIAVPNVSTSDLAGSRGLQLSAPATAPVPVEAEESVEARIRRLGQDGLSRSEIERQVFGFNGGRAWSRVRDVLGTTTAGVDVQ